MNFLKLELKNFLTGRAVIFALVGLLAAGFYAIYQGKSVIDKQKAIIAQIPEYQAEHFKKQIALNTGELGNLLYYLQFSTVHEPSVWAAFSVGQRDVNPYNIKVRMLTLEGQLYDSEMSNPVNLLYGNFDPAFVFVFLFPLLIIAFCHNLISAEQENGIWNLLRSQPVSVASIIGWRLLIRFVTVFSLAFALIAASCLILESAFDRRFFHALLIVFAYLAFWFALSAFIVSFQKSSVFNALSLLGVWILLTILAPALLNLVISTAFPVSESFDVTVRQREGYHQKWDKPKAATMAKFYAQYPQYKDVPIPEDKFSWGWYYAMQNAGDDESADATARYMEKLKLRDAWTNRAALFLPTINTQSAFNSLTKNDLQSHLEYLDSVRNYHRQIREHFYPFVFRNAKTEEVVWQNLPKHEFSDEKSPLALPKNIWSVFGLTIIFGLAAWRKLSNLF